MRPGSGAALARSWAPYVARAPSRSPSGGSFFEARRSAIVFVHISKSAGSTFKKALADVAKVANIRAPYTLFRKTWPQFLKACKSGGDACDREPSPRLRYSRGLVWKREIAGARALEVATADVSCRARARVSWICRIERERERHRRAVRRHERVRRVRVPRAQETLSRGPGASLCTRKRRF